jgi:sugar phosphate isomerase/epimerase
MTRQLYVHLPFAMVGSELPFLLQQGLRPEFGFNGDLLDRLLPEELYSAAASLETAGVDCTIHAPFMDLNPGSTERLLREATARRFAQVMDVADILRPRVMVFHPGYDRWRYGDNQLAWLTNSLESWKPVLERAENIDCTIAVENIFEEEPSTLRALLEAAGSKRLRHCFDVGHWNMFGTIVMEAWFAEMGEYLAEVHLHDNQGDRDAHLPPGDGGIDFSLLFSLLERHAPDAVWTLEAHTREKVARSLAFFGSRGHLNPLT